MVGDTHSLRRNTPSYRRIRAYEFCEKKKKITLEKYKKTKKAGLSTRESLLFSYKDILLRKLFKRGDLNCENEDFTSKRKLFIGGIGGSNTKVLILGIYAVGEGCSNTRKSYAGALHKLKHSLLT